MCLHFWELIMEKYYLFNLFQCAVRHYITYGFHNTLTIFSINNGISDTVEDHT